MMLQISPAAFVAFVAFVAFIAAACSSPSSAPAGIQSPAAGSAGGTQSPAVTPTRAATPTRTVAGRVAYQGVSRFWEGRPVYAVCIQDTASPDRASAATRAIVPLIEAIVAIAEPGIPFEAQAGCPYHYPDKPEVFRDSVSRFVLHVLVSDGTKPDVEILEHWLPEGTDSATPVTFLLTIPRALAAEPVSLRTWLDAVIGPEPTRQDARLSR